MQAICDVLLCISRFLHKGIEPEIRKVPLGSEPGTRTESTDKKHSAVLSLSSGLGQHHMF